MGEALSLNLDILSRGLFFFGKLAKILEERYVIQTKEIM